LNYYLISSFLSLIRDTLVLVNEVAFCVMTESFEMKCLFEGWQCVVRWYGCFIKQNPHFRFV
jgi:hypothetical protein